MNGLTSKETVMGDDRDCYYSIYHRKDKLMLRVVLALKLGESRHCRSVGDTSNSRIMMMMMMMMMVMVVVVVVIFKIIQNFQSASIDDINVIKNEETLLVGIIIMLTNIKKQDKNISSN